MIRYLDNLKMTSWTQLIVSYHVFCSFQCNSMGTCLAEVQGAAATFTTTVTDWTTEGGSGKESWWSRQSMFWNLLSAMTGEERHSGKKEGGGKKMKRTKQVIAGKDIVWVIISRWFHTNPGAIDSLLLRILKIQNQKHLQVCRLLQMLWHYQGFKESLNRSSRAQWKSFLFEVLHLIVWLYQTNKVKYQLQTQYKAFHKF